MTKSHSYNSSKSNYIDPCINLIKTVDKMHS